MLFDGVFTWFLFTSGLVIRHQSSTTLRVDSLGDLRLGESCYSKQPFSLSSWTARPLLSTSPSILTRSVGEANSAQPASSLTRFEVASFHNPTRQRGNIDIDIDSLTRRVMKILVRQPKPQLQNSRVGLRWKFPYPYLAPRLRNANAFTIGAVPLGLIENWFRSATFKYCRGDVGRMMTFD